MVDQCWDLELFDCSKSKHAARMAVTKALKVDG
jgi:hypothetical protein